VQWHTARAEAQVALQAGLEGLAAQGLDRHNLKGRWGDDMEKMPVLIVAGAC
jgi:hypothetical protein